MGFIQFRIGLSLFLLGLSFVSFSCKTTKEVAQNPEEKTSSSASPSDNSFQKCDSLIAYIERTPCYGRCPIYKMKVYSDYSAEYEGKMNTPRIGKFTAEFSKSGIDSLLMEANKIGYFNLNDVYDGPVTDLPAVYTILCNGDETKRIKNRHGGPKELRVFERYFDAMIERQKWESLD